MPERREVREGPAPGELKGLWTCREAALSGSLRHPPSLLYPPAAVIMSAASTVLRVEQANAIANLSFALVQMFLAALLSACRRVPYGHKKW